MIKEMNQNDVLFNNSINLNFINYEKTIKVKELIVK